MKVRDLIAVTTMIGMAALAGCAGDDPMVFVSNNAYADPQKQCEVSAKMFLPFGTLDVADTLTSGQPSPRSYRANFILNTTTMPNPDESGENTGGLVHFGHVDTNQFLVQEMEVSYDFNIAATPPSATTLDIIPQRIVSPVQGHVSSTTKAGQEGEEGTAFLGAVVVSTAIADAMNADPDIFPLLDVPNSYPITVRFRLRGRSTAGDRFETDEFVYPINVCRGCLLGRCPLSCYPEWQDCF